MKRIAIVTKNLLLGLALTAFTTALSAESSDTAEAAASCSTQAVDASLVQVRMQTSLGDIVLELNREKAPITVENFLQYVCDGAYNDTLFHRVIEGFMIQGGGYTPNHERLPHRGAIKIEADNGLQNERGTIAMARTYEPNSATNQFFINTAVNLHLNHHAPESGYWGYTVFGKVIEGMEVVDSIDATPTGMGGPFTEHVPQTPIIIKEVAVIEETAGE